jgi:branched-chain amino acid transport system permease protein
MTSSVEIATMTESQIGGLSPRVWQRLGMAAALMLGFVLPWPISDYHAFQITQAMIYAIALLGLNLLTGYNGQISLGHGAFFAIGGYATAILMHRFGVPSYLTIVPAGLLSFTVGVLFGLPALRLEGLYLALVTISMAVATPQFLKYFDSWTGGSQGILSDKPSAPGWLPIGTDPVASFTSSSVWAAWMERRPNRPFVRSNENKASLVSKGM